MLADKDVVQLSTVILMLAAVHHGPRGRDSLTPSGGDEGLHHFLLDRRSGYLTSCPRLGTMNSTLLEGQRLDGAWGEDGGVG